VGSGSIQPELGELPMTTIVVDKELREKLRSLGREVPLCDETGSTIGWFLPEAEYMKVLYERAKNMFTDEELERAEKQAGGRPLADILSDLRRKYGE
jgi:hypothetical protein